MTKSQAFSVLCAVSLALISSPLEGLAEGEKSLRKVPDSKSLSKRSVRGRVVKDARLELCIEKNVQNAVPCLRKYGYLSEDGKDDAGSEEGATIGAGKGLLENPGARIQKPEFGPLKGGSRFSSGDRAREVGAKSSTIELKGHVNEYSQGKGPHPGAPDKLPPPNPSGIVR